HIGADFPAIEIGDLRHRHAGTGRITHLEGRKLHAPIHHVHVGVLLDVHIAAGFGFEGHVVDVLLGEIGHDLGLVLGGLLNRDPGAGRGLLVVHVLFGLAEAILGGVERQLVLALHNGGKDRVLANVEFGLLDVGVGGKDGVLRLLVHGFAVGLGLDHLLFGFG